MASIYIFIGHSGAGKGTQVALLKEKLLLRDPASPIFSIETGNKFRELITKDSITARAVRVLIAEGELPPPFIGVHMWAHELIERYSGEQSIVIDGTPRVASEVPILLSMIEFYGFTAHVINLSVSDNWAYERTRGRGREDDRNEHDVMGRINWFHQSVVPTIAALRESPLVTFHDINGEQTIAAVHNDICHSLALG